MIHFLPHLESLYGNGNLKKGISKKYPIQPPNAVPSISKLPFPNGSYRNGVCRALWALYSINLQAQLLNNQFSSKMMSFALFVPSINFFKQKIDCYTIIDIELQIIHYLTASSQ